MDVGCGQGTITVGFGQELSAGTVAGFDTQVEHIEQATQLAQTEGVTNVTFRVGDLFQPPFPKASFDIAFANAVISHQANPEGGIVAMKNLVKAGGLVAIRDRGGQPVVAGQDSDTARRAVDIIAGTINMTSGNPHGSQTMGEIMNRLCREAGLEMLSLTASWEFMPTSSVRDSIEGQLGARAVKLGIASREELEGILTKLDNWVADPDAYFTGPWFEVVARKP